MRYSREAQKEVANSFLTSPQMPVPSLASIKMPAIIKTGPKLPSFQKLKKRKRSQDEVDTALPEAPATKKQSKGPSAETGLTHTTSESEKTKVRPQKVNKAFEWKKKMAAEKEERLKKQSKAKTQEEPKAREAIRPGQNWKKLQSTMTHARKPIDSFTPTSNPEASPEASSSNAMQEDGNIPFDRKNKATSPPGWNPSNEDLTGIVALDCEMVGVGLDGASDSLARVVIVNYYGGVLLDRSVRQEEHVVDTRTKISGIRRKDLKRGDDFKKVQEDVYKILKDKIVVGHGLASDFKVLMLDHPKLYTRDTARYRPLQRVPGKPHSLKELGSEVLGISIHEGKHHPVEDAQTALLVYRHVQKNWEASIKAAVKTPSSINPITKLVEKTNREALKVASTPGSPASSTKQKVTKQPSSDVDSWASSESVSEDDSSDASQSNGSDDNSSSGESDSEDSE